MSNHPEKRSAEELHALLIRSRSADAEVAGAALAALVAQFRGVALRVIRAMRITHRGRIEELLQEGAIGVMLAVRSFDPSRGSSLLTWVYWKVRKAIQQAVGHEQKEVARRLTGEALEAIPQKQGIGNTADITPIASITDPADLTVALDVADRGYHAVAKERGLPLAQVKHICERVHAEARCQFPLGLAN